MCLRQALKVIQDSVSHRGTSTFTSKKISEQLNGEAPYHQYKTPEYKYPYACYETSRFSSWTREGKRRIFDQNYFGITVKVKMF